MWSKKKPKNAAQGVVFPGRTEITWSYDDGRESYYFHRFYDFQPDLNTVHPEVQAEIFKIMGFWLQLGVSGFRMDAVPFVIARKGAKIAQAPRAVRNACGHSASFLTGGKETRSFSREANVLPETDMEYFGNSGRTAANDVQFPGESRPFLCARYRR